MTDIKLIDNRIIFDGHANTVQECNTITNVVNVLSESSDFSKVKVESGYAEFECTKETDNLLFAPAPGQVTFIFDSGITNINYTSTRYGSWDITTSGDYFNVSDWDNEVGTKVFTFTPTLVSGKTITNVTYTNDTYSSLTSFSDSSIVVTHNAASAPYGTITITTGDVSVIPEGYRLLNANDVGKTFGTDLECIVYYDTSVVPLLGEYWVGYSLVYFGDKNYTVYSDGCYEINFNGEKIYDDGWNTSNSVIETGAVVSNYLFNSSMYIEDWYDGYEDINIWLYVKDIVPPDTKPVYKRINNEWIKQTAFEMVSGTWTQISTPIIAPIYGVSGLYQSSPALTRTDDAIGMSFAINSSSGAITSDFNNVFPWNETTVETINGNKFVHFPNMWFRVGKDSNNRITDIAVSKTVSTSGNWYKVNSFYYSCYGGSLSDNKLVSVSGATRLHTKTRSQFRDYASANGSGYFQEDLYHKNVVTFLWWIEWATKDSASIMTGRISGSGTNGGTSAIPTGGTDSISTPSGFETTYGQMRYHYIEDFVGNLLEFVDGSVGNGSSGGVQYVTANPSLFSDFNTSELNTTFNSPTTSGTCLAAFGWDDNNPFLCLPIETVYNYSYNTYFCDYGDRTNRTVLICGGHYDTSSSDGTGVSFFNRNFSPESGIAIGGRLMYKPV